MDREKVIKGILQHCEGSMFDRCGECPYYEFDHEPFVCRDMLLNDLNKLLKEQDNCENCAIAIEDRQPVVRCKDCKHWYFADNRIPSEQENVCGRNGIVVTPDWFCADGERR